MKSYLYENGTVSKNDLLIKRSLGNFTFKGAGEILKKYCIYQEESDSFIYTSH